MASPLGSLDLVSPAVSCDASGCGAVDEVGSSVGVLCQFSSIGEDYMELAVCKAGPWQCGCLKEVVT